MNSRNVFIDNLRGLNLISMILFHAIWDLVYIFNVNIEWYSSQIGDVWQICIACTFVILAGYCYTYSHNKLKHGLKVFIAGGIISLFTYVFMPENMILFGVLTMLGSCMIIMIVFEKFLKNLNSMVGLFVSLCLFILTYNIRHGYVGIGIIEWFSIPKILYKNLFTTYMGFPKEDFFSTDYFGIIPWIFLFVVGYFIKRLIDNTEFAKSVRNNIKKIEDIGLRIVGIGPINWIGRHSLLVYMLHQPLVYVILYAIFKMI